MTLNKEMQSTTTSRRREECNMGLHHQRPMALLVWRPTGDAEMETAVTPSEHSPGDRRQGGRNGFYEEMARGLVTNE